MSVTKKKVRNDDPVVNPKPPKLVKPVEGVLSVRKPGELSVRKPVKKNK